VKRLSIAIGLIVVVIAFVVAALLSSVHTVREGFVGIYFRNGALLDAASLPGIHFCIPFITRSGIQWPGAYLTKHDFSQFHTYIFVRFYY
jgi:regulator of protease activity HflC (stomatin/prohibitin superfamily)